MTAASDLFAETLQLLRERPGRAALSGLLVALAVASFVSLTVIVGSSQAAVDATFEALRPRDLRVESVEPVPIARDGLISREQVDSVIAHPSVDGGGRLWLHSTAEVSVLPGGPSWQVPIFAADNGALGLVTGDLIDGRTIGDSHLPLAVVTQPASARLRVEQVPVPFQLQLGGEPVTVVGRVAASDSFAEYAGAVFVSPSWAVASMSPDVDSFAAHRYRVSSPDAVPIWKELLPMALQPAAPEAIRVRSAPDPQRLRSSISGDIRAIVLAVGVGFSLLGIFAIGANASSAVAERRIEIGTKTALGWSPHRVIGEVLAETILLGSIASSLGAAIGALSGATIAMAEGWPVAAPWWLGIASSAAGALAGALAGAAPARRAGSIHPAQVLRGS